MIRICWIILLSVSAYAASAQKTKTISGEVKDAQTGFLPGATVSLLRADSTLVRGTATDANGKFEFKNLTSGSFRIGVRSIGNNTYISIPIDIDDQNPHVVFPVIVLMPSTTMLQEVVTVGKRPLVLQDIDKTTVHVDAMIGSAGSNTLEVLEKTPGVTVGTDGAISLNGQGEVLVLIDNRPTYLSRQDLALYLKSLPGGSLDRIELMTNPPAQFDAAGSSIINIRLKKNRLQGLTGSLAVGYNQGVTSRSNNALNVNYKRGKINLFGNVGYSKDGNYAEDFSARRFFDEGYAFRSSVQLLSSYKYSSRGVLARLGMDYAASPNTVYGFSVSIQDRPRQDRLDYNSFSYNTLSAPDATGRGYTKGDYTWSNLAANFNYQHTFKAGREISADLNYIRYTSCGEQELQNFTTLADGAPRSSNRFLYVLPSGISIYTAKGDYLHALKKKAKLEMGVKSSVVINDNQSHYYDFTENGAALDFGRSNHFIYRENINAAYINARKDWKRIAAQVGVRVENTQASGRQPGNAINTKNSFERTYTSIFPNVSLRYKIDSTGKNALNVSFSRRINRANYHQLNPFLFYRDNYSYTSGNPDLNPQYNYIAELKYQHDQFLGIGLRYGKFEDIIFSTTQAVDNVFITRPGNIANGKNLSLTTNLSLSLAKWWHLNANLTFAHLALKSRIYHENLSSTVNVARMHLVNQFKFNDSWSGELAGNYGSRNMAGQTVIGQMYRVNAAIQKEVLPNKGTVRLVVEDLFHSWKQNDKILGLRLAEAEHTNEMDTRRIGVAFTYRFGKENFGRKRKHTDNAADEEKGRVEE